MKKKIDHLSVVLLLLLCFQSHSQTIYVDKQLSADCAGNYSISNRDCNGSDGDAYKTLQSASTAAIAGTQVLIREGVFNEQLCPQNSGGEDDYITFKNFEDEVVEITGTSLNPAIWIDQKDYIVIEGLKVHDVRRWLNALGSNHIIIRNNEFERALDQYGSSKTGPFLQSCTHVKILNNIINESTQDNIGMVDCDYNLIEGNTITKAVHTLWALKCSNYNVIRGNFFYNELQKIGEVYDCDNVGFGDGNFPKLTSYDDTKYNVIENNIFAYTPSPSDASPYSGIQYAGQNGIIRNNIFYECEGPPIALTLYSAEAKNNYGNRISHNVFFDNEFGGIQISGSEDYNFSDQKIKNNIFFKNKFVQRDFRWSWYNELNDKPVQILTGRIYDIVFENNNIFNSQLDELYVIAYGVRTSNTNLAPEPLSWWETYRAQTFTGNLQVNPDFIDTANKDFHLQQNSPMIDAGIFLTKTTNSGNNSTAMEVDDAGWFMDGFGIVSGDTIQIEGQNSYAIIQSINYTTKTLTFDRALSWDTALGVSLKYCSTNPDIGACEFCSIPSGAGNGLLNENIIAIIPNPTYGIFKIESDNSNMMETALIYNSSGQQVKVAYRNEVNISCLDTGIYYVKITSENGRITTKKVVKY